MATKALQEAMRRRFGVGMNPARLRAKREAVAHAQVAAPSALEAVVKLCAEEMRKANLRTLTVGIDAADRVTWSAEAVTVTKHGGSL